MSYRNQGIDKWSFPHFDGDGSAQRLALASRAQIGAEATHTISCPKGQWNYPLSDRPDGPFTANKPHPFPGVGGGNRTPGEFAPSPIPMGMESCSDRRGSPPHGCRAFARSRPTAISNRPSAPR